MLSRSVWRRVDVRWLVVAAWLFVVLYAYPGYLNYDSGDQLFQSRTELNDWHPPLMAAYWHLLDMVIRGPVLMLLLQTALFSWGVFAAYRLRLSERAASIAAALTIIFPPVLTPMAAVWKDAQMAAFLIAGVMLALRDRWPARIAGLALLVFAAGVRDNGAGALPPLMLVVVAAWGVRRQLAVLGIAAAVTIAITGSAILANKAVNDHRAFAWYTSVAIIDLAGTICHEGPLTDDEVRAQLDGMSLYVDHDLQTAICARYTPRGWFQLTFGEGRVFLQQPDKTDRLARGKAWKREVREHTGAWLEHRWAVMRELLGLSDLDLWEPVCQTVNPNLDHRDQVHHDFKLSVIQKKLGQWYVRMARTIWFRAWAYALGCLLLLGFAAYKRDGWIAALAGSGLLYEATFFLGATGPDYRYSHWMVTCCVIAVVTIFVERYRAGRAAT